MHLLGWLTGVMWVIGDGDSGERIPRGLQAVRARCRYAAVAGTCGVWVAGFVCGCGMTEG